VHVVSCPRCGGAVQGLAVCTARVHRKQGRLARTQIVLRAGFIVWVTRAIDCLRAGWPEASRPLINALCSLQHRPSTSDGMGANPRIKFGGRVSTASVLK
jgi:hypothetical protein